MSARRLYRGLSKGNILLLVSIQITDPDLGDDIGGRSGRCMETLNGGAANPKLASKARAVACPVFIAFLPGWSPSTPHHTPRNAARHRQTVVPAGIAPSAFV